MAVIRVEPFLPSYTKPRTCEIPAGSAEGETDGARWAVKEGRLEVGIPRGSGEGRFRVTAWSDAVRYDRVPDAGRMKLVFPP